jgi:hypothetical protein
MVEQISITAGTLPLTPTPSPVWSGLWSMGHRHLQAHGNGEDAKECMVVNRAKSYIALVHATSVMVPVAVSGSSPSPKQSNENEPFKLPSSSA